MSEHWVCLTVGIHARVGAASSREAAFRTATLTVWRHALLPHCRWDSWVWSWATRQLWISVLTAQRHWGSDSGTNLCQVDSHGEEMWVICDLHKLNHILTSDTFIRNIFLNHGHQLYSNIYCYIQSVSNWCIHSLKHYFSAPKWDRNKIFVVYDSEGTGKA